MAHLVFRHDFEPVVYVDADGQLDRLVLQSVVRRPITSDKPLNPHTERPVEVRFYDVDGDSFVLRYSKAITLNIQYLRMTTSA